VLAQQLRGRDWGGKVAGVMGLGRMGQSRPLAAGDKAPVAVLPVRKVRARLLPLDEGRLVAPVIDTAHRVQMRFAAHERVHQVALLPDRSGPVGIVRLGQHIRAEVAFGVLRLLHHGHGAGEELVEDRRVLEPEPCNYDDRHRYLPCPAPADGPAGADDVTGFVSVSMPVVAGRTRDHTPGRRQPLTSEHSRATAKGQESLTVFSRTDRTVPDYGDSAGHQQDSGLRIRTTAHWPDAFH